MYITREPVDLGKFFLRLPDASCGAAASFVGLVRNHDQGRRVQKLYYECYESMADKMIGILVSEAHEKWNVKDIHVSHRIGPLEIGEAAVAIAVSSSHRDEAFRACRYLIEEIKKRVPIWKKEIFEDGTAEWVTCSHPVEMAS